MLSLRDITEHFRIILHFPETLTKCVIAETIVNDR